MTCASMGRGMKPDDRRLRSTRQRYQIWRRQNGFCAICGESLGNDFTIDHRIPVSAGGLSVYWNLQAVHLACNLKKGKSNAVAVC